MEREKRKKISPEKSDVVVEETKKKTTKREREVVAAEEPTTEEVEEFFAILRRMNVALEYFKGAKKRLTESRTTGTAKETAAVANGVVEENKELDLNEVPVDANVD